MPITASELLLISIMLWKNVWICIKCKKKLIKIYATYANTVFRAKKHKNAFFFIAGLSKITGSKNKKLQNIVSFFYIHVTCEKSTTYANFVKNSKNYLKIFFGAAGLSKQLKNTIIRCALMRAIFYICIFFKFNFWNTERLYHLRSKNKIVVFF